MFCKCFTVISRISAFSNLDCCWETGSDVKLVQSVDMWGWDTWLDTHIQPERPDHSFLQLIQTVVYSLPSFPLDEWFPHLWGGKNNNNGKAARRRTTRRSLIQTHMSVFMYIQNWTTFLSSLALECLPELYAIYDAVMFPTGRLCASVSSSQYLSAPLGPSARRGPVIYQPQLACECANSLAVGFSHTRVPISQDWQVTASIQKPRDQA